LKRDVIASIEKKYEEMKILENEEGEEETSQKW